MITHDRPLFWVIANAEILKVEDLLGKTVAVDRLATLQDIVARDLIKRKGANPEKITFIQTGSVSQQCPVSEPRIRCSRSPLAASQCDHDAERLARARVATEFNMRAASGGIATREVKLKQEPAQVKAILRATFETMDFNRRDKSWMVGYIQKKSRLTPSVAEEAYRYWLQGLTSDGKIPLKDLQETYDQAYASQLIPTPVNVKNVIDYTPLDEMLKEKKIELNQEREMMRWQRKLLSLVTWCASRSPSLTVFMTLYVGT